MQYRHVTAELIACIGTISSQRSESSPHRVRISLHRNMVTIYNGTQKFHE